MNLTFKTVSRRFVPTQGLLEGNTALFKGVYLPPIGYFQGYIFCKLLWWGVELAAGKKMKSEGVGKKMKRKKEKNG